MGDAMCGADDAKADDNHQDELEARVEEEADLARPLPVSEMPTRSELLDHCATHCPYRAWCKHGADVDPIIYHLQASDTTCRQATLHQLACHGQA